MMKEDIIYNNALEINILNQIKSAFPSYTNEQAEAALLLLKIHAGTLEMTFDDYIERYHPKGIAERDDKLPNKYKGYIEFLGDDAASIIHAGKTADFSTFIHECAHAFRRQLTGELKELAEKAFHIQDGKWTVGQEEYFAKGLEQWIILKASGKKGVRNRDKQKIYEKGAAFVSDVYKGLEHFIDITPEMEAVYEKLFENNNRFNQKEYEDILHNIAQDKLPNTSHVYLGMTPRIYEEFGFERLPMMITGKHLYTTLRASGIFTNTVLDSIHYHDLGEDIIRQIPEQLKKPLVVIQSDVDERDIISIIELRDKNNNPVIVPIQQFVKGNFNSVEINANLAKSIYGKVDFKNWIKSAVDDNRLLFVDKKKTGRALSGTNQPQQSPSILPLEVLGSDNQDVSGFFINSIARYKENFKRSAMINGKRMLFHTNVNQLAFDFDNDAPAPAPPREIIETPKTTLEESGTPQNAESGPEDDAADAGTPDFRFSPAVSADGKTFDFRAVPANKIYLVSQKTILSKERPSWIPDWDMSLLLKSQFIPPFKNHSSHFEVITDKGNYLLTPEVFAASIDYYMKYQKQLNQEKINTVNSEKHESAKNNLISRFYSENKEKDNLQKYSLSDFDVSWDRKNIGSKNDYLNNIDVTIKTKDGSYSKVINVYTTSFHAKDDYRDLFFPKKADRVNLISKSQMTNSQYNFYKNSNLTKNEIWKKWKSDRDLIDQKLLDMQGHLEDFQSAYVKGKETSYGDANLNDSLVEKYGVMVKRQNGDIISREEIAQIETALGAVTTVFGNLKDISREYGLKISHSSDKLMHASKYSGLFTPFYKSLGVSFKAEDMAPVIMVHEYSHFLDAYAGKTAAHFFASDIKDSPENKTASLFRASMNGKESANAYYKRTCECFARACEQYAAYKTNPELYKIFCSQDYYCGAVSFEKIIPEIEKLIAERRPLWRPPAVETVLNINTARNEPETIITGKRPEELSLYQNFLADFIALAKTEEYADDDRVEAARHLLRTTYAPFKQNILNEMKERGCVSPESSRAYLLNVLADARENLQYSEIYVDRNIDYSNGDTFKVYFEDGKYNVLSYDKSGASIGYDKDDTLSIVENRLKERGASEGWELSAADDSETTEQKKNGETDGAENIKEWEQRGEDAFKMGKLCKPPYEDIVKPGIKIGSPESKENTKKMEAWLRGWVRASAADFEKVIGMRREQRAGAEKKYESELALSNVNEKKDGGLTEEIEDTPLQFPDKYKPYGAWLDWNKRLSEKQRIEINQKVLELLQTEKEFSEKELDTLRLYSGFGGVNTEGERGVLYDYYTSPPLAGMTWRLLDKSSPLKAGERVLEPSCGAGVFIENAPSGVSLTGVELDGRTAAVAEALQQNAEILNMSFEHFNISDKSGGFDRVIGNVPFGERPADTAELDFPGEKSLDNYFLTRSIDNLKSGGTLALITAPGVLNNKSNENFRRGLLKKAQFLGAVQLPNKSFHHTHTGVQPLILLFKKYPDDIERRMKPLPDKEFEETSLYDRNFAEGSYFKAYPHHVMGEISEGSGQFGSDEIIGELTPDNIEAMLSVFTPAYQHDAITFDELRQTYETPEEKERNSVALSKDEASLLAGDNLPSIKIADDALYILSSDSRWELVSDDKTLIDKIERITRLTGAVSSIREAMKTGSDNTKLYQSAAAAILETYKDDFGEYPPDDKNVRRFVNKYPAVKGIYDAFITPASEILTSDNIYASGAEIVDGHNPAVKALTELQNALIPATEENIKARFPANADNLVKEMFAHKDIFHTPKGIWQLREDFISGDAWQKIDMLRDTANVSGNDGIKQKLLYGAAELEKAVGWTPIEDADFSPRSAWIDEDIIRQWVSGGDGLEEHELKYLSKNNEGKWGVKKGADWAEYHHPLIYYLNGQKQRSKNIDTKAFNEEHDELFKAFISNHAEYRQNLEVKYNRLFKTNLGAPVKTYPVDIKGWQNADGGRGKTLKPHQWQTVHHLYRQGTGISALGTGFGKTASAVGLMSLLRQEDKLSRVWLQVPNNKVKDWTAEIKDVMPHLKIASIDPEEPGYGSRDKRYARYWQIANSKADVIIMPESAASEIQLKKDNDALIRDKISDDYKTEKTRSGASERQTVKAELKGLSDTQNGKTNRVINFEDFGCDALFVDEAHNYKNLFSSNLSRETGMNDGRQSAKAMSLFKKTDYIRENNNGKNVFLLTATPLTNSPLEYYNMLQFIASDELKRFGILSIDGFIREFADIKEGMKYDWTKNNAGWGKILTGFKNLQTLQDLFFKYTDLQNDPDAVGLEKPEPRNMPNIIPSDDSQTAVLKSISAEIERYRNMDKEEREAEYPGQNFLTFYSQMRTASLDLELFDPDAYKNWKNPKLEKLTGNVKNIYDNTKGGQVIFCDRIFDSDSAFNLHDKIKASLAQRGFKDDEIVVINGFTKSGDKRSDSSVEKDVSKAIDGYNSGKYKVIIGTTACIGEGVNLQKNSSAVHHFDIPFRPSDFIQRNGRVDRQGNDQDMVELHTYLATGTIDNYSVALVQNKANWIDSLLRTKSNVFTNPDDENSIDMNELLLSLTEEWGDKEKAAAMREELLKQKADAERDAWDKKMRANLKSLSLLRASLQQVKNKDGRDFKNRLDKIHNLERALGDNPLFNKPDLLGSLEPFLYNAKYDIVLCKGDLLLRNKLETVTGFDFKKQSILVTALSNPDKKDSFPLSQLIPAAENTNLSYRERSYDPLKHHFERPSEAQLEALKLLTNIDAFYSFPNKDMVKDFYKYHLASFSRWDPDRPSEPPVFTVADNGKLIIGYARYSVDDDEGFVSALNPFLAEDRETIIAAAERGIILEHFKHDALYSLTKKHFPDLHKVIIPHLKKLDLESLNLNIINDYRSMGFASTSDLYLVSNSVLRNKNIVHKENKMESNENLNEQAGSPVEQPVKKTWEEREADLKQNFSPEVVSDTAAKYHALHGATEWRTDNGEHRLYFNFAAKKHLYGLSTYGKQDLSPEKIAEYQTRFNSTKLIDFPEKAFQNGKPLSPEKAFEILYSNPCYDMNQKKLIGLLPNVQTRADYLKQRSLDMGGKEYVNEEKGMHRIYFQTPTAIKNLYGLETKGKTDLSPEQLAEQQAKFPYVKFLPNMPESATLRGQPIEPQRAFDMLASRPFFDVKSGKFELFSKEDTFDMFVNKEFNKKDVTETRRAELLVIAAKHDRQIKDTVNEAAVFAAKMKMEVSAKDMSPAQQLKAFLQSAVENDNIPWEKGFSSSAAVAPHNCDTGKEFTKNNLIAASLHMAHIGSNDPRYLTEDKIRKNGLMVDENAVPLKIAYRTAAKDGTYQNKITSYYNARDIAGMPPLTLPKSINELSHPVTPERSVNPNEQISANMAGFIAALSSNRAFEPAASGQDYKNFSALPVNDLFAKIHGASAIAAEISKEPMEAQIELGRQAAGMEM